MNYQIGFKEWLQLLEAKKKKKKKKMASGGGGAGGAGGGAGGAGGGAGGAGGGGSAGAGSSGGASTGATGSSGVSSVSGVLFLQVMVRQVMVMAKGKMVKMKMEMEAPTQNMFIIMDMVGDGLITTEIANMVVEKMGNAKKDHNKESNERQNNFINRNFRFWSMHIFKQTRTSTTKTNLSAGSKRT
jgi:hypothetical protein